jgi:hypothetical protein
LPKVSTTLKESPRRTLAFSESGFPFYTQNIRLELSVTDEFDRVEENCIINDMSELVQGFLKSLGLVLVEL